MAESSRRQFVPRRHGRTLISAARLIVALTLRGDALECPCCGGRFRRFLAYGHPARRGARCPSCGSLERHRATWLYLRDRANLLDSPHRVLDIAPTPCLAATLQAAPGIDYLSIDLESPLAMQGMDVTRLNLPDSDFDVVLCSHVLEHVPDDAAAMRELLRVLRPGGQVILQTPWDPGSADTDEDPSLDDPAERARRFGQADHVRIYGRDLFERLGAAGWEIELVDLTEAFGAEGVRRFGLLANDPLIVGRRER